MSILNFVDIETTGLHYNQDQMIEIAVVKLENHKEIDSYETLIKPTIPLNPYAQKIHGITESMLRDAPQFGDISQELYDFLQDGIFVAHNARFDYSFVKNTFASHGIEFETPYACTVKLSRYLYPQYPRHGLSSVSQRHHIIIKDRHRAMGDTAATVQFYHIARQENDEKSFIEAFEKSMLQKSIPVKLISFDFSKIPNTPGVYIFKNDKGEIIYIGKSIHLQDRVKEHFYASSRNSKEMEIARHVADIEWIETIGEVGALIREAILVKKHQPQFNVALRSHYSFAVREEINKDGYKKIEIVPIKDLKQKDFGETLGLFRSKMAAFNFVQKRVEKFLLCSHILHGKKGVCFQYHLGECEGACAKDETPTDFNSRFDEAFQYHRIPAWPFEDTFEFIEDNNSNKEVLKFKDWRFIESDNGLKNNDDKFNYDIYKIISKLVLV